MYSRRFSAAVVLVALSGIVTIAQRGSAPSIVGVWRVSEVTYTGPNARTVKSPQPGVRIFTQRHYGISQVNGDNPRAELPPKASDRQLVDAFNAFIGQSGTYEIRGDEITRRPIAALNPNAMRSVSLFVDTFKLEGNTLWLTTKATSDGPVANPTTARLTRIE